MAPASAIDFHILRDSGAVTLDGIRERSHSRTGDALSLRPYIVEGPETFGIDDLDLPWAAHRGWTALLGLADKLAALDSEKRRVVSSSALHVLRSAVFEGAKSADATLKLHAGTPAHDVLAQVGSDDSLFSGGATRLIDLMDVMELRCS